MPLEKIGGLWWDGDRLVVDPVATAFKNYVEKHGLPPEWINQAFECNALLRKLCLSSR